MDTYSSTTHHYSSQRGVAMVLALVSAIVLSPLYVTPRRRPSYDHHYSTIFYDIKWSSGFVLPMFLVSLIFAIKTTSSSSRRPGVHDGVSFMGSCDDDHHPCWVLRIGSSTWGLAGVLVMLLLVLSWQESVQHFFWR
ncbi:hypothetical protein M5689_020407 [Euphorbia peplus]|nr:hypothetical protein M5689_020407 [Euphorbia peplus]